VKGSTRGAPPGYAFVKDRCEGCGKVVYGMMPLNVELPPPRCSRCAP
jgi:hypothetical protein